MYDVIGYWWSFYQTIFDVLFQCCVLIMLIASCVLIWRWCSFIRRLTNSPSFSNVYLSAGTKYTDTNGYPMAPESISLTDKQRATTQKVQAVLSTADSFSARPFRYWSVLWKANVLWEGLCPFSVYFHCYQLFCSNKIRLFHSSTFPWCFFYLA